MKKLMFIVMMTVILIFSLPNTGVSQDASSAYDYEVIPDDAIRLRILANSDQDADQQLKHEIRDAVNAQITEWVEEMTDIDAARRLIESKIPVIKETVERVLAENGSDQDHTVEYGSNVTFPVKLYGSFLYPAGEYEAVLITLGDGQGSNWWCVLFPPLCFLDFSNGTSTAENDEAEQQEDLTAESEDISDASDEEDDEEGGFKIKFFLFDWLGLS
ncbi:stage II sporulation protein R [Lentibacillus saliphilus]|uniref:stage II sporulation protein R n=1 Tax=Lentibacillus saliphilus TaxID=2737028 RepID=UPI001C2F72E0|nr:stage II sporulation protein R [Lentibacillus saliphilus]